MVVVRTARLFADDAAAQGDAVFFAVAHGVIGAQAAFAVCQLGLYLGVVEVVLAVFAVFGIGGTHGGTAFAVGIVLVKHATCEREADGVSSNRLADCARFTLPPPQGDGDGGKQPAGEA